MFIVTLLANPTHSPLTPDALHLMAGALSMQGARVEETRWLQENVACELLVDRLVDLQAILRGTAFDAIAQPYPRPRYRMLISDMDSTLITCECIDELADFAGKKKEVAAITERAMNGELVFEETLEARVALLAGLPEAVLEQCYRERVRLMPGAKALVAQMKAQGAHTVLVSGGFTFFTSRVRDALGMDEDFSNQLEVSNGRLTGRVIPPILGKRDKLATLEKKCRELAIDKSEVLAVGDGANDLPMLLGAGLGVAYHAKPTVRAQARAQINHCDLSALIFI